MRKVNYWITSKPQHNIMDHPRKEWLLCFDFDGTLIDPKKSQEIDPSLQKALSLIREKKAAIVINTGRSLMAVSYTHLTLPTKA